MAKYTIEESVSRFNELLEKIGLSGSAYTDGTQVLIDHYSIEHGLMTSYIPQEIIERARFVHGFGNG